VETIKRKVKDQDSRRVTTKKSQKEERKRIGDSLVGAIAF